MEYYMNNFTGELYESIPHMVRTIVSDMIHCPKCRTWKMFNISKVIL